MLLYGNTIVSAVGGAGDTRRGRQAQRRDTRAGVGQQRVAVAVVAAGELDDLGAAGVAAGQPDRAHGGLGAGVDHAQPLDRGDAADDLLRPARSPTASARRTTGRRPRPAARPRRRPGGRGRGSSAPTSTPGRRSGCRRRRSASSPVAEVMNRGVPPTEVKARTGEFTPPGMTAHASAKSFAEYVGAAHGHQCPSRSRSVNYRV